MRELRFRVSDTTFEKFSALAISHGLNLTSEFCLLVNIYSANTPLTLRQYSADTPPTAEWEGGYRGLGENHVVSREGVGGENQPERTGGGNQPTNTASKRVRTQKTTIRDDDPELVKNVENVRAEFPAGYKGDRTACIRHGKKVNGADWSNVVLGARHHVAQTPRKDLKFAEADVFLRKQLWGRYLAMPDAAPPPPGKPVIRDLVHAALLKAGHRSPDFPWRDYANGPAIVEQIKGDLPAWREAVAIATEQYRAGQRASAAS